jgi:hypothetical protein
MRRDRWLLRLRLPGTLVAVLMIMGSGCRSKPNPFQGQRLRAANFTFSGAMQGQLRDLVPIGDCEVIFYSLAARFEGAVGQSSNVIIDIRVNHFPLQAGTYTVGLESSANVTITKGTRHKWIGQSGNLTLNSYLLSGTIDTDLTSSTDKNSTLHVSGDWIC